MNIRKIFDRVYLSSPNSDLDRPVIGILKGSSKTLFFDAGSSPGHVQEIKSNHSVDQSILFIPEYEILFLGDALYLRDNSEKEYDDLFKQITKYNAKYYIDSHNEKVLNLEETKKYCLAYVNSL